MAYTPQTWADGNVAYPASAARFAYMEAGIASVSNAVPKSLADYNVLPGNTAAVNTSGFATAAASSFTDFYLPAGTYQVQLTEGGSLMNFVSKKHVRVRGTNAVLNDTTTYTNQGAFTPMFLFNACTDVEVSGIEYVGPVLGSPSTLLGYQGAIFVRAINGTDGVKVDAVMSNLRYGVQTGEYGDPTKGQCSNFNIRIRGTKVGYSLAAYYADGIRHDLDIDGVHRSAYIAGCNDVRGVARWRDQYIADTAYEITDVLISGTDAAAQVAPPANPTSSRGCTNVDIVSIDKGSTVFQTSSRCAGITVSRVDPIQHRNIRVQVYSKGDDTTSTKVGGFDIVSDAKTIWSRYSFNWEPTVVLDNITVSGMIDHSAATLAGNSGSELYMVTYDSSTSHAATVRNLNVDGFTFLPSSASSPRAMYLHAPGLASPARFRNLNTPGIGLNLFTNATVETILEHCNLAALDVSSVTGGSRVVIAAGTKVTSQICNVPITNTMLVNGTIGGAASLIKQRETTLTLSGATTTWTGAVPTGAVVLAVQGRVQTTITGATGYQIGPSGDVSRYVNTNTLTSGSTFGPANQAATETFPRYYFATTDLIVTAKTSNFTGGVLRLILTYLDVSAPTS